LLTKLADNGAREWYAQRAIAEGWSRTSLELNIRNRLHERQGQAVTNFGARLSGAGVSERGKPQTPPTRGERAEKNPTDKGWVRLLTKPPQAGGFVFESWSCSNRLPRTSTGWKWSPSKSWFRRITCFV